MITTRQALSYNLFPGLLLSMIQLLRRIVFLIHSHLIHLPDAIQKAFLQNSCPLWVSLVLDVKFLKYTLENKTVTWILGQAKIILV